MSNILRLAKELQQIKDDPDHSIYVAYNDEDVRQVNALLVGPAQTPYAYGIFSFSLQFPSEYPQQPPKAKITTTNGGQTRFNPNLYASGKVCLSILNTWRGEPWTSALGVSSCLNSILSLFSENPYHNEPGCEEKKGESVEQYNQKVTHETIRITVIDRLERSLGLKHDIATESNRSYKTNGAFPGTPQSMTADDDPETDGEPTPKRRATLAAPNKIDDFTETAKVLFLVYYELYLEICAKANTDFSLHGKKFVLAEFEGPGNQMKGSFDYPSLMTRLTRIREALDEETRVVWRNAVDIAVQNDQSIVYRMKREYEQCTHHYRDRDGGLINLSLEDEKSDFTWIVSIFGRPMSQLDGGIIKVRFSMSLDFPRIQPRIQFLTKLFHPNINSLGYPYLPSNRGSEMRQQIDHVVAFLEREPDSNPSARINPEASRLYWGSDQERKQYNRQFRRCIQDSLEEV